MGKHKEWRKLAKKFRRKRIRQQKARIRDFEEEKEFRALQNSSSYKILLAEKLKFEEQKALEEKRIHDEQEREWLRVEREAQVQFRELQKKLELARQEREKQNEKIRLEWEEEQKRREEIRIQQENELKEKIRQQELLQEAVEKFIEQGGDTPEHLKTVLETNPNKTVCPFFNKTSTCRFFDVCSRNHIRPGISKILLIPNFFSHYSLEKTESGLSTDSNLEFEKREVNNCYREFYKDVVPEIENYGKIRLFFTCCNHEAHLRGNVFIEFFTTQDSLRSYRGLNGRWYGGKQLSAQFVNISNWSSAICGDFFANRCPKGSSCNFLHIFRNPGNVYCSYEKTRNVESQRNTSESRNWRWSESPERPLREKDWEDDHYSYSQNSCRSSRNGERRKKKKRSKSRENDKRHSYSKHSKERHKNKR